MSTPTTTYTCPYCRIASDGGGGTCPHCGAPVDIRERVSDSGWAEQPPIRDMARIQFSRSTCQISGKYVPVADMNLHEDDWVYFSHHVLLHTDPRVRLDTMKMARAWNRMLAGMPLIMMTARGPGHIAFSHDDPARPWPSRCSRTRRSTWSSTGSWSPPATSATVEQSGIWFTTQNGDDTEYALPARPVHRPVPRPGAPGLLLLHAPGNVFIRDLAPGQHILIQPSALLYKDPTVRMHLHFEYPRGQYWFARPGGRPSRSG